MKAPFTITLLDPEPIGDDSPTLRMHRDVFGRLDDDTVDPTTEGFGGRRDRIRRTRRRRNV